MKRPYFSRKGILEAGDGVLNRASGLIRLAFRRELRGATWLCEGCLSPKEAARRQNAWPLFTHAGKSGEVGVILN
jgi:hypothetical protein